MAFSNVVIAPASATNSELPRHCDSQPLASFPIAGADESWSGAVAGGSDWKTDSVEIGSGMTLEDYLTHNEAVREDVRAPLGYGQFHMPPPLQFQAVENPIGVCGNGSGSGSSGRGKRQAFEPPVDKATAQKQRRMIKNRESAARSRERKQAKTTESLSLNAWSTTCSQATRV
uniref:BZIP domain-containing protein n=1 Tax=Cannabis sativa TaxID=3483 RepID=A0A803Q8R7_CANSA